MAFAGYCVQANGYHWGTKMTLGGADWPTGSPAEQWDALPAASKWQIILFVGIMELFAESVPPHYMKGGQPGKFPSFAEAYKEGRGFPPCPSTSTTLRVLEEPSPEAKARGLLVEINNGRGLGIFGFLAESKVSGSVPVLTGLGIPHYDGDYMAPFAANFHIGA
ncbi:chlorophyll A-B binding protein [Aureococcus anophagefferens]|nr:chlorophyll A-B binding protein [Aureococcus anophagefferens]